MSVFQCTYHICNMFRTQLFKSLCRLSNKKFQMIHHLYCDSGFDITCPLYKSIPCFLALTSHILFVSLYSYALRMNNKFFLLILCNMRKLILILVTAEKSFLQTLFSLHGVTRNGKIAILNQWTNFTIRNLKYNLPSNISMADATIRMKTVSYTHLRAHET